MTAFMERNDLRLSWHHPMANKSNAYVNHNLHHESCIDHFVVSSNVYGNIRQHDVNDTPLNPSTHCPVMLVFNTSYRYTYDEPEHVSDERPIKIAWHKVISCISSEWTCIVVLTEILEGHIYSTTQDITS